MIPRIFPFGLYLVFLALESAIESVPAMASWGMVATPWIYPVKTAVVLGALVYFWPRYGELKGTPSAGKSDVLLAGLIGVLVYLAWVRMD